MQEKRPKLSVIVPMWGVEKYIEKCARSLFESTLDDMEFIFVDDCTPDKSVEVLERVMTDYPKRVQQTCIVHHEVNKGLPQARKTGYEACHGEWITYCDSDDWVHPEMYEKMLVTSRSGYDLVCCDFVYQTVEKVLWKSHYGESIDAKQLRLDLMELKVSNAVWNKIVHRSIYENDIYFPQLSMDEDDVLSSQFAYYAVNIGYTHDVLYYHYANPESMTHENNREKKKKHLEDRIENLKWIVCFLESQKDESLLNAIFRYKILVKTFYFEMTGKNPRNVYSEVNAYMMTSPSLSLSERINNRILLQYTSMYPLYRKIVTLIKTR